MSLSSLSLSSRSLSRFSPPLRRVASISQVMSYSTTSINKADPKTIGKNPGPSEEVMNKYLEERQRTVEDLLRKQKIRLLNEVSETSTVFQAVQQMAAMNVGVTMIKDDKGGIAGIFTERDYLKKIVVQDKSSNQVIIRDVMTPAKELVCVDLQYSVYQCMHLMKTNNIRHLPVVNEKGELQGVLGMKDLIGQFADFHEAQVKYLQTFVPFPVW